MGSPVIPDIIPTFGARVLCWETATGPEQIGFIVGATGAPDGTANVAIIKAADATTALVSGATHWNDSFVGVPRPAKGWRYLWATP